LDRKPALSSVNTEVLLSSTTVTRWSKTNLAATNSGSKLQFRFPTSAEKAREFDLAGQDIQERLIEGRRNAAICGTVAKAD
jgi:hypothetical protein